MEYLILIYAVLCVVVGLTASAMTKQTGGVAMIVFIMLSAVLIPGLIVYAIVVYAIERSSTAD